MIASTQPLTLEAFLQLPETEPTSEFLHNQINQKPMPQGEHSLLQGELCKAINEVTKPQQIAYAFPELRCTFGGGSIVPDISVFRWDRIPRAASGKVANRFLLQPDWAIEILSPDQSLTKVLANLLHCSQHGTELGWLLNPAEASVVIVLPEQRVQLMTERDTLPILTNISLSLTVEQVFSWLEL